LLILIGPEGGWDAQEEKLMKDRGFIPASLGKTVLRVETAAIVAAALRLLEGE
jgi:16S rRNA (uracil1498-N3)-methyltransferase